MSVLKLVIGTVLVLYAVAALAPQSDEPRAVPEPVVTVAPPERKPVVPVPRPPTPVRFEAPDTSVSRVPRASPPKPAPPAGLVDPGKAEDLTAAPPAPNRLTLTRYVTGSVVNVRDGPSTSFARIGQVRKGEAVSVIPPIRDGWAEIERAGRRSGWMSATYLSEVDPLAEPVTRATPLPTRAVAVPTVAEITRAKDTIIQQSILSYPGSCPCPYSLDRAGRRCGARSAWSRPGGYAPICYESDVTDARLASFLARQRGAAN